MQLVRFRMRSKSLPRTRRRSRRSGMTPSGQLCCRVDSAGRQHFNFRQQVWLHPAVPMAYTKVPGTALTTLAANLLALALQRPSGRESRLAIAIAARCARGLARQFCEECLLAAPEGGWVMPRATIRAWLARRLQARREPVSAGTRARSRAGPRCHARARGRGRELDRRRADECGPRAAPP